MITRKPTSVLNGDSGDNIIEIGSSAVLTVEKVRKASRGDVLRVFFILAVNDVRTEINFRVGETFYVNIGEGRLARVYVTEVRGNQVQLALGSPPDIRILRGELARSKRVKADSHPEGTDSQAAVSS